MWLPFRIPYRWLPRTIWPNLKHMYYDLVAGPYNLARWFKIIWYDCDWDHSFLLKILAYKFRRMAERQENARVVVSWGRQARQLRICQHLVERLNKDEYWEKAQVVFGNSRAAALQAMSVQKYETEYLGKLIGKHLLTWWD